MKFSIANILYNFPILVNDPDSFINEKIRALLINNKNQTEKDK